MSALKDKPLKKCHTDNRKMIDELHNNIVNELNDEQKIKYYLDNGLILNEYYKEDVDNRKNTNNQGILSYFSNNSENNENEEFQTKKEIIEEYMCNIDDSQKNNKYKDNLNDKCTECDGKMNLSEISAELICENCGITKSIMIVTERSSYNDPPREVSYFAYKRINHFNEWLAQFQAKEKADLPENIFKDIKKELDKNKSINANNLNYKQIREILKKLNYNKYYEHIPHIISIITGKKAPVLDRLKEEQLRSLFKEIQIPFINNCPANRKNFLSYSYVLHKFCELLEYDHLLEFFPLLKSREKLYQQDLIWEKICNDLKWQFIPSV